MFYTSISNLLRRTFLLSLFFGAGIFLVTTVLFFERERFVAPLLKEYLTEFVRSRAGAEFEIGEIRGNYYSELHFSMVRFASPRAPLRSLRASSLRVHYWLPALASGIEPFLSTIEIIASGGELDMLFAKKGKGASSKISQKTRTPLPWIPKLKGDDFSVKLARGRESVFLAQASFDTAGSTKEEVRVQVRAPDTKITSPFLKEKTFSIDTEFSFSRGRVLVRHAIFNNQVVTRSAEVTFGEEHPLHLRGLFEVWGGKIRLDQRVEAGILQGRAEFHSIDLAKIHRIISLKSFPEKGTAFFDIDISTPVKQLSEAKGSLRAHFEGLQVNGIFIEEVRFKGRVTEDQLFVENALFHAGENRVAFEEVLLPKKSLKQGKFFKNSESFSGKFNATLLDVPEFVSLLKGKPLKTAFKAPRHELSFLGNIKKGTFHFEKGVLKSGGSTVEIRRAELPLFRRGTDPAQVSIGAEGRIRINDLKDFSDLFNLPKMTGSLAGEISLNGTLADPTGTFRLKGKNIRRKSVRFDTLNLQGEAGKKRVTFSKIKAFSGKDTLEGSGAYDIAKNRIKQTKLIVDIHNVSPYLALVRPEWKKVSGRFKGVAEGSGAPENPRIVASAVLEKWVQPDFSLYSGKLTARLENQTLDLGLLSLRTTEGTLSAILSFSRLEKTRLTLIRIPTLSFLRDGASFALLKPALISLDPSGKIFLKNISFAGSPGRVDLSGMLNSNHEGDIKVVVNGRSSESIPDAWMPRRFFFEDLTFTAHLTGSFSSPEISVSGEVKKIGPSKDGLILKGMYGLTASSKGINITQFNFSDNDGHRINLGGKIPFGSDEMGNKPQGLSIDADVNLDEISPITSLFLSPPVPEGQMVAKISIRGTPAEPLGEIHLHTKNFTLAKLGFFPFLKNVAGDIDLHTDTRQIFLDKVSLSSDNMDFSAEGSWEFGKTFEELLDRKKLTGSDSLDLSAKLKIFDISSYTGKTKAFRRIGGVVSALGRLTGSVSKPDYRVALSVSRGSLQPNITFPSFADLSGEIVFEKKKVEISDLAATVGGSPFTGEGTILLGKKPVGLNIHLGGDNLLYYRRNGIKIRGNTTLHLEGDWARPVLRGEIGLTESKFVRNVDFLSFLKFGKGKREKSGVTLFSFKNRPMKNAVLNVAITSAEPFVLKNNLVTGTLRPDLMLKGTGEVPVLSGNIYIDPITFSLPYGNLHVTGGVIRFLETSPDEPVMDVNAEGRLLGHDIFLHAEGPTSEPVVTLSSVPPLPEDELLLLVLAGELPKETGEDRKLNMGLNVAVYLSRSLLANLFESDSLESDDSILDRFNLEVGKSVSKAGAETVEAQFLIKRNLMGRKEEWFLTSERDRFDEYNSGIRVVFKFE